MAPNVLDQLSPRARDILVVARRLLEEEGAEALSMRNLAERLEMRAPSLYKHFESKEAIEAMLISVGFEEQAAIFSSVLDSVADPLRAMAKAYRSYALANPQMYRLMYDRALNRPLLAPGVEEAAARPSVVAAAGNVDLARALWAFAHGMTILELNRRFPEGADLDAAWETGLAALASGATGPDGTKRKPPARRR